ncbi:MAG: hypothetical protein O3A46_15280 [Candidatus Poribacteria bacterium]|nr:hypothetical protein [Candidatus Poribacteria bacterium]
MLYEVLYYDRWGDSGTYELVGAVEGDSPEDARAANLDLIKEMVRDALDLDESDVADGKILETTYIVRDNGLLPVRPMVS